ncbi:MAG: hypothetical protein EXR86_12355 [Gammaproteobacteria bacterium]|nr:hypothetical protein [Gammaproteobacteria bacterium]
MANEMMKAALAYENQGYSVIPLVPRGKIPLIPSWVQYQITRATREEIGAWWRLWPEANLGIVTGDISGICVIDCDSPEAATAIKPTLGDMADVGVAATGKGFHLYYAHTVKLGNRAGVKPQVDFRGDGGYVVAPPSIHATGKVYEWVKPINGHLRELPPEFVRAMTAPALRLVQSPAEGFAKPKFDTAGALAGLPVGQRDEGIFKLACKLRRADVPYETALELCEQAAANCQPKFDNARRKVDQAYKYSPGHGQQAQVGDQASFWPEPLTASAFLDKTVGGEQWLWDNAIPINATSMIAGQPRTGKSTLALNLALAISRGVRFLGRDCTQANACYVSIDNSDTEFRAIADRLGVTAGDNLWVHTGKVPDRAVDWISEHVVKAGIKFLVVDTYQRFFSIKNINDAQECIDKMGPLDFRAKELGIHVCYLHHAGKGDQKSGDPTQTAALGSIAIKGMVPWYLQYSRVGSGQRILTSDFRGGKNFDQVFLEQDRKTGWTVIGGNLEDALVHDCAPKILDLLTDEPELTEAQIQGAVEARALYVSKALRRLFQDDHVGRSGVGKRGDPFKYFKVNRLGEEPGTELRKVAQLRDYIK